MMLTQFVGCRAEFPGGLSLRQLLHGGGQSWVVQSATNAAAV